MQQPQRPPLPQPPVFPKLPTPPFKQWKITKTKSPVRSTDLSLLAPPTGQTMAEAEAGTGAEPSSNRWLALRQKIDQAKDTLNTLPRASEILHWLDVFADLRQVLESDKYNMFNATNATIKMYELLVHLQLLTADAAKDKCLPNINVFCNAELPGGFIIAINHFVQTHCPDSTFNWVGSSLWPAAGESQLEDDLELYEKNPDHWVMGVPPLSNGDVTQPDNLQRMHDKTLQTFEDAPTLLYTSDIGVAFPTGDKSLKNQEEEIEAILNYGQILAGLMTLGRGGHLVTKQFTFTTPFSRSLIGLVASLFEETYIAKPQTSRVNNSEVYLVAKGFEGMDAELQKALLERLAFFAKNTPLSFDKTALNATSVGSLLSPAVLNNVDDSIFLAAEEVGTRQIKYLEEVAAAQRYLDRYRITRNEKRALLSNDLKQAAYDKWLSDNDVQPIAVEKNLSMISPKDRKEKMKRKRQERDSSALAPRPLPMPMPRPPLNDRQKTAVKPRTAKAAAAASRGVGQAAAAAAAAAAFTSPFITMFQYQKQLHDELESLKAEVIKTKLDFLYGFMNNANAVVDKFELLKKRVTNVNKKLEKVQDKIKSTVHKEETATATGTDDENELDVERAQLQPSLAQNKTSDDPNVLASLSIDMRKDAIQARRDVYKYNAVEYIGYIGKVGFDNGAYSTVNYDQEQGGVPVTALALQGSTLRSPTRSPTRSPKSIAEPLLYEEQPINILSDLLRLVQARYTFADTLMKKLV